MPTSDSTVCSPAEQAQTTEPVAPKHAVLNGDGASLSPDDVRVEVPFPRSGRMYRRTKKPNKKVKHWWRTRPDPLKDVWQEVEQQLVLTPHGQATALFRALQQKYPGPFKDGPLRTLQRRGKAWRLKQVRLKPQRGNDAAPLRGCFGSLPAQGQALDGQASTMGFWPSQARVRSPQIKSKTASKATHRFCYSKSGSSCRGSRTRTERA